MLHAEFVKIVRHRVPKLLLAVMLLGHSGPSLVLIVYTPDTPAAYGDTWTHVFQILPSIIAVVFGAWILGTEYRQDTLKRTLTAEPRRTRVLSTKAAAGGLVLISTIAATAIVGWSTARVVAAIDGHTVSWNGRELLAGGLFAVGTATVAFALSAITRNDAISMVATLALVLILDPLLSLVPWFGKYTFAGSLETVTARIGDSQGGMFDTTVLTNTQASLTLAIWLLGFLGAACCLFHARDV